MENIEKEAKNDVITFQIGIAQMILMLVVKTLSAMSSGSFRTTNFKLSTNEIRT